MEDIAAHNLEGRTLSDGWKVIKKKEKLHGDTGGHFSVCYLVEKDGHEYFMKAFNVNGFINTMSRGKTFMEHMEEMSKAFQYEKRLSEYCQEHHVSKVQFVIASGEEQMPGFTYPIVPYLIFELASGDVRQILKFSDKLDFAWKLKSLHDVSIALKQLHGINVSHQDIKPSNILIFNSESKVGDIGRSMCPELHGPYDDSPFSGDNTYAPPEVWFNNHMGKEWKDRNYAIDCYLLGSIIAFYITAMSMTAMLKTELLKIVPPPGTIEPNSEYLQIAFMKVLEYIEVQIPIASVKDDLITLITYLCHPDPLKRGHPQNRNTHGNQYNLERFASKLDLLQHRAEIEIYKSDRHGNNL